MQSSLLHQLLISLVVMTSTGTLVQDTKLNKALEVTAPLSNLSVNISSHLDGLNEAASAHTHVEQPSISQQFAGVPKVQARDDHRRYIVAKYIAKNKTASGDSQILWPSTQS